MANLTCKDCPYFWKDEDDEYPHCQWRPKCADDRPLCEEEEYEPYDYEQDNY